MAANIDILIRALDQASGPIGNVQDSLSGLDKSADQTKSRFGGLGSALGFGLKAAAGIGVGALVGLGAAIKTGVGLAKVQIEAEKQLAAVIESTGMAAGLTADQVKTMASELQNVTNFGDEAILSGQNLLLTFTNIGEDVFPRATETMLDMSTAMGQDMKSSAIQLGKALNDPIGGISALSRVGVQFTDEQKEMIEAMVEAGDVAGAQGVILDELATQVGGSARAMADPAVQLQNAWGDFMEEIGRVVIPILNDLARAALPLVVSAIEKFSEAVRRAKEVIGPIIRSIRDLFSGFQRDSENIFAQRFPRAFDAMTKAFDRVRRAFAPLTQAITNLIRIMSEQVQRLLAGLSQFWQQNGATIMRIVDNTFNTILTIATTIISTMVNAITLLLQVLTGDWQGAMQTIRRIVEDILNAIKTIFRNQLDSIRTIFMNIDWAGIGRSIMDGIANGIRNGARRIADAARNAAQSALNAAKRLLGIGSPSAEAEQQIGRPFAEGIEIGIRKELDRVAVNLATGFESLLGAGAIGAAQPAAAGLGPAGPITISIVQNFGEGSESGGVGSAARDGVLAGLRQAGLR